MSDPYRHELPTDYDSTTWAWVRQSALNCISAICGGFEMERIQLVNGAPAAQTHYVPYADGATVYNSGYASGNTITFNQGQSTLMLEKGATVAALTVTLPPSPVDGQQAFIVFGALSVVTTLTMQGAGTATIVGAATSAAAGTSNAYQYNLAQNKWYRMY